MRSRLRQYRRGADVAGRKLRQLDRVHHLSGALAGHCEIHGLSHARISEAVQGWALSAEYAADRRSPGAAAVSDRGERGRGALDHAATAAGDGRVTRGNVDETTRGAIRHRRAVPRSGTRPADKIPRRGSKLGNGKATHRA